jgi:signal transduction histidine kinase
MQFTILSYIPCALGLIGVGLLTLLKNPRNKLNIVFAGFAISLGLWVIALFFGDLVISKEFSLWALRIGNAIGMFMAPFIVLFGVYFPVRLRRPSKWLLGMAYIPTLIFIVLAPTPFIINDVQLVDNAVQLTSVTPLYSLQTLYIAICWILGIVLVLRKFRRVGPRERAQIKLVLLGLAVALLVNIGTNYVLAALSASSNYSNFLANLSLLVFVISTSYAIVRYRLFDIRRAIIRIFGYTITVGIVATMYSFAVLVVLGKLIGVETTNSKPLMVTLVIVTIFVSFTFQHLRQLIDRLTMSIFYRHAYSIRQVLDSLTDALVRSYTIEATATKSLHIIAAALQPVSAYLVVTDDKGHIYKHFTLDRHQTPLHPELVAQLMQDTKPIIERDLTTHKELAQLLDEQGVTLALRLGKKAHPTGYILFGHKHSGSVYNSDDIRLLHIVSKNLSLALENAKKYEQIERFADTLKHEVDHATTRLRHANEELKQLDKLKDDFISMASHQFRTPAGSIRQALQMINGPGLTSAERKEMLRLAEINSEELVTLVSTMLSISRLQAGRFLIDKSMAKLDDIVERVLAATTILADQKRIKLVFEKPERPIATQVDVAKIKEAMTNYTENAIKYSPEGSTITIRFREEPHRVYFEVLDQGMGVPEDERSSLFGKFYRAQNARHEQPDGNGIGLYVVKSIAEGHHGEAYYEALNPGSLFGFWLPYTKPSVATYATKAQDKVIN